MSPGSKSGNCHFGLSVGSRNRTYADPEDVHWKELVLQPRNYKNEITTLYSTDGKAIATNKILNSECILKLKFLFMYQ